jgi:hypothetical protein
MPADLASPPSLPPRIECGVNFSGNPAAGQPGRHNTYKDSVCQEAILSICGFFTPQWVQTTVKRRMLPTLTWFPKR